MTLTMAKTVFAKKTLIFSHMVASIHRKVLEINVKYKIIMKRSYYFIGVLLVLQ